MSEAPKTVRAKEGGREGFQLAHKDCQDGRLYRDL